MNRLAINSNGEAVTLETDQAVIRTVKSDIRIRELQDIKTNLLSFMQSKGIDIQKKDVCFMIQPHFVRERLVFFTKTEVSSSSQFVKDANEIEKHPEILSDPEKLYTYQSVISDTTINRPCWYYLSVGYIDIERNFFDGKRISITYRSPIPYMQFKYDLKKQSEIAPPNFYQLINDNINMNDMISLLPQAFDRDISDTIPQFDILIQEFIEIYSKFKGIFSRNINSNNANTCLMIITDTSANIYPIYVVAKNLIKKTFRGSYGIQYKQNLVKATIADNTTLNFYIGNTENNPCFLLNGNLIEGYDNFQTALQNLSEYTKPNWYTELVENNLNLNTKE